MKPTTTPSDKKAMIETPEKKNENAAPYYTVIASTMIAHWICGGMCAILGIAAIPMYAWFSFYAVPIWGGLILFVGTGIVGGFIYNYTWNIVYLALNIVTGALSLSMIFMYSFAASWEQYGICQPGGYEIDYCYYSVSGREAIDVLIVITCFAELAASILAVVYCSLALSSAIKKEIQEQQKRSGAYPQAAMEA